MLLRRLVSIREKVVRELVKALDESVPGPCRRQQKHSVSEAFDDHVVAVKAELAGESHALATAIAEKLCGLHRLKYTFRYIS